MVIDFDETPATGGDVIARLHAVQEGRRRPDCWPGLCGPHRRLVTDPLTGHLLDRGRRTYAIPQALRDHIVASPANLGALCTRHHQLKTFGRWIISDSQADASCTWTSPQGREYEHSPPGY